MTTDAIVARPGGVRAAATERTTTRALLAAGVAAGPVWLTVAAAQALTRDGYDLSRQPLSLLALGDLGWIQTANFVLSGLLAVVGAVGMRRALRGGRAGAWGPALVAVFGLGLLVAGVFVSDPSMGFPAGAPEGAPPTLSWHAALHGVGAMLAFGSLTVACLVFARRFAGLGQRGWALLSVLAAVAVIVVMAWPDQDTISVRMAVGSAIIFGWLSAVSARLITGR
jgi:Protein of unknown function (DUF998)